MRPWARTRGDSARTRALNQVEKSSALAGVGVAASKAVSRISAFIAQMFAGPGRVAYWKVAGLRLSAGRRHEHLGRARGLAPAAARDAQRQERGEKAEAPGRQERQAVLTELRPDDARAQ